MRTRIAMAIAVAIGWGMIAAAVRGQDFGSILRQTARDVVGRTLESGPVVDGSANPLRPEPDRQEIYSVRTEDGWTLVARRFRATGAKRPGTPPVILCHGLSYNADFWDLDPACSPARFLAAQGYDVWAVDLRGSGLSQKWVFKLDEAPEQLIGRALNRATKGKLGSQGHATVDPKYAEWDLDDHIVRDVPALVRLVRQQTRATEVIWIGHSMGGIVALAHLSRYPNPGIGRLVTVGSQVTMRDGQLIGPLLQEMLQTRQQQLTGTLQGRDLVEHTRTSVHNLFFNVRNVSPKVYEALATTAMDIPAPGLLRQYMLLSSSGELWSADRKFNYARAMGKVKVPILVACGAADTFAPPPIQKELYDRVGSTDKMLLVWGRAQGCSVDAGHDDALVGLNSAEQVYPVLARWLRGERW